MMYEEQICKWVSADPVRMRALRIAHELSLPDWCIAAGFVRNLVWDRLHGYETTTPLADIDLVFFDPADASVARERLLEEKLAAIAPSLPWSVRNQARMHVRNGHPAYGSTIDAMRHWVEQETAVGVKIGGEGEIVVLAAFGMDSLFAKRITPNPLHGKPAEFEARLSGKDWLRTWPELRVSANR
ncbi:nucleotidyltransferase family protein [Herbaspirillum sp. HC18]|nr:nucleotidyltransferase family protein [Herbaspirillum sp. HC18]